MSSDDKPSKKSSHPKLPAAPYGPRNNLHSSAKSGFTTVNDRAPQPKFGSTTPMKSTLAKPSSDFPPSQVNQLPSDDANPRPYVSEVQARAQQYMQPIRATAPSNEWRTNPISIDLTGDNDPTVIRPPAPYTTFSAFNPVNQPIHTFSSVSGSVLDRKPPVFSLPGGGAMPGMTYFGGEAVDSAKTTESIKELLEGINDSPVSKRSKRKKKRPKTKEDSDIAELMNDTKLEEVAEASQENKEDVVEGDEDKYEISQNIGDEKIPEDGEDEDEVDDEDLSYVDGLNVQLLPHQIRGLDFMQSREEGKARGGILADDMGLGKTIQSIALLLSHPHPRYPIAEGSSFSDLTKEERDAARKLPKDLGKGTLVIAPVALIKQWEGEIARRTSDSHRFRVRVHHGPNRAKDASALKNFDVVITTYDTIRSEHTRSLDGGKLTGCFGIRWWRIICDEAHTIKNRNAKSSIAACALSSRYRWCLTGTPLQNNLDELQALFKYLRIAPFDDFAVWKEQISRPMQQNRGKIAIDRLRVILSAVMLRRTKDVLKKDADGKSGNQIKLPERHMKPMEAVFNKKEQEFYTKLEDRTEESLEKMMSGFGDFGGKLGGSNMTSALVLLLRLRQACNHPHLLAGKIHKDKDSGMGLAAPRKRQPVKPLEDAAEDDELADLLGGLSVDQQKCDVCFRELTKEELASGVVRCTACTEDIKGVTKAAKDPSSRKKDKKKEKEKKGKKAKAAIRRQRPIVLDSEDEDGDNDGEESQAEEGSDTEDDEGDTSFVSGSDGFIDSQAEESSADDDGEEQDDDDVSDFFDDPYSQLLESTKIRNLILILKKEGEQKNKTIVFSQFTSMLDLIEPFLHKERLAFARYDGSMKNNDREASLRRLRAEGEFVPRKGKEDRDWCGVLLCSLKCGALGLNLTCASRVVILEPFWNPFIEEQAIDRVHRIGQTKDVIVYKITIKDSVEERILKLQNQKRELAKAAIGDGGSAKAAKLSMKDILSLFRRDAEHVNASGSLSRSPDNLNSKTRILKETRPAFESSTTMVDQMDVFRDSRENASAYSRRW